MKTAPRLPLCRSLLIAAVLSVSLQGCGDDGGANTDATPAIDAAPPDASLPDAPPPLSCQEYCAAVTANCTDELAQYPDAQQCAAICANAGWQDGTRGDMDGNSLACRIYHANAAGDDMPELNCPRASPWGGAACGSVCEVYCDAVFANCADADLYADRDACLTACDGLNQSGRNGDIDVDTVQCRIYHAGLPAAMDPTTHCPHAASDGGGQCVD